MAPSDLIFGSSWDSLSSLAEGFESSSMVSISQCGSHQQHLLLEENQGTCSGSAYGLAQNPSVSDFYEDPRIFSAMVGLLGVPEVENFECQQNYGYNGDGDGNGEMFLTSAVSQGCRISEEETTKFLQNDRRRKRDADKKNEEELKVDLSKGSDDVLHKKDDKKQKIEGNLGMNSGLKQEGDCKTLQTVKRNSIHVRARRGQATNSHSFAERVRREKISERMRVLQELVPGCSKITGKAVMLDEIINYVQSLQQQVEFLAMKLATVYPGITVDLERALSKHFFDSGGAATTLGVGLYHPLPPGNFQEVLLNDQKADSQHVLSPQTFPKEEQQNSFQS